MKVVEHNFTRFIAFTCCVFSVLGCRKDELKDEGANSNNDSQVAIQLSAGDPEYVMTRAALDSWSDSELYVFGIKRKASAVVGNGAYDYEDDANIVDYKVENVSGQTAALNVYREGTVPYYYVDGWVYDFYGYHLGGAIAQDKKIVGDSYSYKVTFQGNNDLMYATTDKAKDVAASGNAEVTEYETYSAWAARRGVNPKLVFNHALARLNFIVKGVGNKYDNVIVTGVDVKTVNTGMLTVAGSDIGFIPDPTADAVILSLKNAQDEALADYQVTTNNTDEHLGGEGACLMVTPNVETVEIYVYMKDKAHGVDLGAYTFVAKATDVAKFDDAGNKENVTVFEAGHAYNFYIKVYGPEEVVLTAELTPWIDGDDYTYDPDDMMRPGSGSTTPPAGGDDNTGGDGDDNGDDNNGDDNGGDDNGGDGNEGDGNEGEEEETPIAVKDVTLSENSVTLNEGESVTLVATVNPSDAENKNVTWSSNNNSVATVVDGLVTALTPGTATITVTTEDGSYTATCEVTVLQEENEEDTGSDEGNESVGEEDGNGSFN